MTRVLVKSRMRTRGNGTRWCVQIERKRTDAWIGAYWEATKGPDHRWAVLDVWVCLLPTLPIHLFANRKPVAL